MARLWKALSVVLVIATLAAALGYNTQIVSAQVCTQGEIWTDKNGITYICDPSSPSGWSPLGSKPAIPTVQPTQATTQSQKLCKKWWLFFCLEWDESVIVAPSVDAAKSMALATAYPALVEEYGDVVIKWLKTPPSATDAVVFLMLAGADGPSPAGDVIGVVAVGGKTVGYICTKLIIAGGITAFAEITLATVRRMAQNGTLDGMFVAQEAGAGWVYSTNHAESAEVATTITALAEGNLLRSRKPDRNGRGEVQIWSTAKGRAVAILYIDKHDRCLYVMYSGMPATNPQPGSIMDLAGSTLKASYYLTDGSNGYLYPTDGQLVRWSGGVGWAAWNTVKADWNLTVELAAVRLP